MVEADTALEAGASGTVGWWSSWNGRTEDGEVRAMCRRWRRIEEEDMEMASGGDRPAVR